MTPNEFVMWLDGYIAGGGQDMAVVAEKAKGIRADHHYTPPPSTPFPWDDRWTVPPVRMTTDWKPYRMGDGGTLCQNIDPKQYTVS